MKERKRQNKEEKGKNELQTGFSDIGSTSLLLFTKQSQSLKMRGKNRSLFFFFFL